MQAKLNTLSLIILLVSASVCFAQEQPAPAEETVAVDSEVAAEKTVVVEEVNEPIFPDFPYVIQISADNVNIRSGPGTNYYICGKLNRAYRVKVVARQFSWSRIVPPKGSFSWISKQYIEIDPNQPGSGTVTGNNVRVYAGSDHLKPIHSTTMQLKLNTGDKVELVGEEQGDYYKIAPPTGAYLWVSTDYTEPLGPAGEIALEVKTKPDISDKTEAVVPAKLPYESEKLKEYYDLTKQIQAQRKSPIAQQNYEQIKKALAVLAADKEAGKAGRYSEFAIKQIERYELAVAVAKDIPLQDKSLEQTKAKIESARQAKLARLIDMGKFAAVGVLQKSSVYDSDVQKQYYRIIDADDKTICYALPEEAAAQADLSSLIDKKVGLVGTVEPHVATSGALVRFTAIEPLP